MNTTVEVRIPVAVVVEDVDKASTEYLEALMLKVKSQLDPETWKSLHRMALPSAGGKARWAVPPDSSVERLALAAISSGALTGLDDDDVEIILKTLTRWYRQAGRTKKDLDRYESAGSAVATEMLRRKMAMPEGCPFGPEEERKAEQFRIAKAVDEEQVVYVIAIDADTVDSQDEFVPAADARKAAHRWMEESRVIGWNHKQPLRSAVPVESFMVPEGLWKFGTEKVKEGDWIVGVHVRDPEEWATVKALGNGASIGGYRVKAEAVDEPSENLEELNKEVTAMNDSDLKKIPEAEELTAKAVFVPDEPTTYVAVCKYSDDQARDDRGRFGSGGAVVLEQYRPKLPKTWKENDHGEVKDRESD